jgi:hypothetical protein
MVPACTVHSPHRPRNSGHHSLTTTCPWLPRLLLPFVSPSCLRPRLPH